MVDQYNSPLLINEPPLQVLPSLAKAIGNINEAIILQQIQYWLKNPKSGRYDSNGRKYIRDTTSEWNIQFPWLTERSIKTRLKSLKDKGLILTANLNKSSYDRTNWYSIDYDVLNKFMQMHSEETSPSKVKKLPDEKGRDFTIEREKTSQTIPKNSTKTSSETSTNKNNNSPAKQDEPHIPYKEIIDYLNQKVGGKFRYTTKSYRKLIKARWRDGYKLKDFKQVIDNKAFSWQNTDFWQYMNPSTLFKECHFSDYLNENNLNKHKNQPATGGYTANVSIADIPDDELPF